MNSFVTGWRPFSAESTRFVKYDKLIIVDPRDVYDKIASQNAIKAAQDAYQVLLEDFAPEDARAILPLCLKSELYMTANLRELRHILKLRTAKAAHPQMRFVAGQILSIMRDKLPVIVEDIGGD